MPQITYIDTDAPQGARKSTFWRRTVRLLVRYRIAILVFMALYRLLGLSFGEMQQWDESIYALRVQTLLQFGDLWDQSPNMLSGLYYAVHPPLYVWCSTTLVMLLGDALWVYRLTSALAAALLIPLIYGVARSSFPAVRSLVVAGLFAFAPMPTFFSRQGQLDLLLALGMLIALYFGWKSVRSGRAGDTFLAGAGLGAALLTKFAFALSVPAALALAGLLYGAAPRGRDLRARALRVAVLMTLVSLPFWLPWFLAMTMRHGEGNVFWLFSPSLPLGATFHGAEGTAKDTGILFYVNQLVVLISVLFPFWIVGMWDALRGGRRGMLPLAAVFVLLSLIVLMMMRSSFIVYLIPSFPFILYLSVHGMAVTRRASRGTVLAVSLAAALCLAWSMFPDARIAIKQMPAALLRGEFPIELLSPLLLLAGTGALLLLIVWLLYRRARLRGWLTLPLLSLIVSGFAAVTMLNIWTVDDEKYTDGAGEMTALLRSFDKTQILLVGNGDNPQITWYLRGADIGWVEGEERRYVRLEPRALGADGVRTRAGRYADTTSVAMVIERDEITEGMYRTPEDVLPDGFRILRRYPRYVVAMKAAFTEGRKQ
jgi:4-amino-4-deoxy-L-arabinose transferase-like glycosyltransferase